MASSLHAEEEEEEPTRFGEYITSQYSLLKYIFSCLSPRELAKVAQVCREWNRVSKTELLSRQCPPQSYVINRTLEGELPKNWPDYSHKIIPEVVVAFLTGVPSRKAPVFPKQSIIDDLHKKYNMQKCDLIILNNYRSIVSSSKLNKNYVDHKLSNDQGNALFYSFLKSWSVTDTIPTQMLILGSLPGVKFRSFQMSSDPDINAILEGDELKGYIGFFHKADHERRFKRYVYESVTLRNIPAAGGTTGIVISANPATEIATAKKGSTLITISGRNVSVYTDLSSTVHEWESFFQTMADRVGPLPENCIRFAFCFLCVNRINAKRNNRYETQFFSRYFPNVPLYGYWSLGEMCCRNEDILYEIEHHQEVKLPHFQGDCGSYMIITIRLESHS